MATTTTRKSTKSTGTSTTKKKTELTPYQQEQLEIYKKIQEFKLAAEASAVAILYKCPDKITEVSLTLDDITNNCWKVYYAIAYGVIITENKGVLSDVNIGFFLEKHPKLSKEYEKLGGFEMIQNAAAYVDESSLEGYVQEIKKWNAVTKLVKYGFPVTEVRLKEYVDMAAEDIYKELEGYLNHIFANVDSEIKSYNALSGLHQLVDKLNAGEDVGLPLTAELLNKEIGGLRLGNIYSLTGGSGSGKSTILFNYILPEIMKHNERVCIYINEEDETKVRKELLLYCATNVLKKPIKKVQLRDGHFDDETLKTLHEAADWLEEQDKNHNITVIPLERYTASTAIKLIKKFKNLFNVNYHILDTFKESSDSTEEAYRSMLKDSVALYDTIKPAGLNVCLIMSMQTSKSSLRNRHLTNADIGQAKSVVDVFSCSLLVRRAEPDEYRGGKKELKCFKIEGKSKVPIYLEDGNYYFLFFIAKNRFGVTDQYAIVTKADLSTNSFKDMGYAIVPEDW